MRRCILGFALIALAAFALPGEAGAAPVFYSALLNGPSEAPPNASTGFGTTVISIDSVTHLMTIQASFQGLTGNTTASHIHAATATPGTGTAGVATQTPTFTSLPLGVTAGSFSQTLDMSLASSYNAAFITANGGTTALAEAALFSAIGSGRAYLNIHTSAFPGGEIRGFLTPIPEPGSVALMGIGLVGMLAYARRRAA